MEVSEEVIDVRDARDGVVAIINQRGFKKSFIAQKSGLSNQQLSDILSKRRKMEANEMFRICVAMGVTPNDLFADTDSRA